MNEIVKEVSVTLSNKGIESDYWIESDGDQVTITSCERGKFGMSIPETLELVNVLEGPSEEHVWLRFEKTKEVLECNGGTPGSLLLAHAIRTALYLELVSRADRIGAHCQSHYVKI